MAGRPRLSNSIPGCLVPACACFGRSKSLACLNKYVEVAADKGENRSARHLALNPMGKVPALVDNGRSFFESGASLGLPLGDHPRVAQWVKRCGEPPALQHAR